MSSNMLTSRQKEVLNFISKYIDAKGVGPTLDEISEELVMGSASAAYQHVKALENKGYLKRLPHQARSMSVIKETEDVKELSLVGAIALGNPIESFDYNETIKVPSTLLCGSGPHYILESRGDSMNEDGILDGDLLIVKETSAPENGDIVVAQIRDEGATLKKFFGHTDKIELRPKSRNISHKPQFYPRDAVEIQGKFCGLIRRNA